MNRLSYYLLMSFRRLNLWKVHRVFICEMVLSVVCALLSFYSLQRCTGIGSRYLPEICGLLSGGMVPGIVGLLLMSIGVLLVDVMWLCRPRSTTLGDKWLLSVSVVGQLLPLGTGLLLLAVTIAGGMG